MGAVILIVILFVIAAVYAFSTSSPEIIMLWAMVGAMIVYLPTAVDFEMKEIKIEENEIKALKDNRNVEGSFYLGSGKISEEDYYYYMVENYKGLEMKKVASSSSYINEVSDGNYKVETYKLVGKSPFTRWFFGFMIEDKEYIFYVPEDSVQKDFKVDME